MNELVEISYTKSHNSFGIHHDIIFNLTFVDECNKPLYKVFKLSGEDLGLLEPISNEQLNDLLNKFKSEILTTVQDKSNLIDRLFAKFIDDFNHGALSCRINAGRFL